MLNANSSLSLQIEEFLTHVVENPRTARTYKYALTKWLKHLNAQKYRSSKLRARNSPALLGWLDVPATTLHDFRVWMEREGLARFTRNTYQGAVISFLGAALQKDWAPDSFSLERVRAKAKIKVKRSDPYPVPKPPEDLPRLIGYFDSLVLPAGDSEKERRAKLRILRARAFVHCLYASAGRLSEVAQLTRKDVGGGRRKETTVPGKGGKDRVLMWTADARAALRAYLDARTDEYESLFISHGRAYGKRLHVTMLWRIVHKTGKMLGMNVSPHDFRHFRARQFLNEGAPIEAIQEILGHEDLGTTRRVYAHYSKPSIRAIFERASLSPSAALEKLREEEEA